MNGSNQYRSVVFAGGGNRCIWQAGFWEVAAEPLGLRPQVVAACSAGACMSAMVFGGITEYALEQFKGVTGPNPKNAYWENLFNSKPIFPHVTLFSLAIMRSVRPGDLERLKQGPEIRVLMSRPPRWTGPVSGTLLGFVCYLAEKHLTAPLHPRLPLKIGFKPEVSTLNACRNVEELTELLLATSCTPPIVPVRYWEGRPILDGGLIDNAPVAIIKPEEQPTLVLLTRRYPKEKLIGHPGRTYIQPSQPVGVSKWDYTDPDGMQYAYDLGRRDAERFLQGGPAALQV